MANYLEDFYIIVGTGSLGTIYCAAASAVAGYLRAREVVNLTWLGSEMKHQQMGKTGGSAIFLSLFVAFLVNEVSKRMREEDTPVSLVVGCITFCAVTYFMKTSIIHAVILLALDFFALQTVLQFGAYMGVVKKNE